MIPDPKKPKHQIYITRLNNKDNVNLNNKENVETSFIKAGKEPYLAYIVLIVKNSLNQ